MDPIVLIIVVAVAGFAGVGVAAMVFQRRRRRLAYAWYFDRQGGVSYLKGDSFAGLVAFPDGGFLEREGAVLQMRSGRVISEKTGVSWGRKRSPVYLVRAGDSSPIAVSDSGQLSVQNVTESEFEDRLELAADLAVANAAERGKHTEFINIAMGGTLLLLALATAIVGVAVAAKGSLNG